VGSALDIIASGPTVPDSSTWQDAWAVLERYALIDDLPETVEARLQAGLKGGMPDTPKPGDAIFERTQTVIIADNALAAEAAHQKAAGLGFNTAILTTFLQGEAREVAKMAVSLGREVISYGRPVNTPACLILGGETTVTLRGTGKGGRNQELALAAALALDQFSESEHMVIVSLATDGTDGPTDSAGAMADATTVDRGMEFGLVAEQSLAQNDSYPYLRAVGDLLLTGPTRTNVNDLIFVFVF
jgi:hydroxypyruvate reductase